jgi:hypothetical protein
MLVSTEISMEGLRDRNCVAGSYSLSTAHERVMCKLVRVKHKLQWRTQDFGDARNMEYLLWKAVGKSGPSNKEATWGTNGRAIWAGLPKLVGSYIMTPIVLNAGYRATVFNIFPDEF